MVHTQDIIRLIRRNNRSAAILEIQNGLNFNFEQAEKTLSEIEESEKRYILCPSCNSNHVFFLHGESISICLRCNAIFGEIRRQDINDFVDIDDMISLDLRSAFTRYFDFKIMNENKRIHGFYDPETKKVVQWG